MNRDKFIDKVLEAEVTLYHVSKSILIHEQDCEDAVQNAILKAYDKLHTLKEEKYFKTWLIRILINECYNLKRRVTKNVSYEETFENTKVVEENDYTELYQAIIKLPPKIRVTVVLYYVEGYCVDEIKRILKVPSGTVKSRLSRGRKLLKIELNDMEGIYE